MGEINTITINAKPTSIEMDPTCHSVYIRFKTTKVERTIADMKPGPVMIIDLNAKGLVIGIELVGIREFSISAIRRRLPERFRGMDFDNTRLVQAASRQQEPLAA